MPPTETFHIIFSVCGGGGVIEMFYWLIIRAV